MFPFHFVADSATHTLSALEQTIIGRKQAKKENERLSVAINFDLFYYWKKREEMQQ